MISNASCKMQSCGLQGLALIDRGSHLETIRYFPVAALPEDVPDRFVYY